MTLDEIAKGFNGRISFIILIFFFMMSVLVWRLWTVQIRSGTDHARVVEKQSMRKIRLIPPRGLIKTSDGVIIADNIPAYNVYIHIHELQKVNKEDGTLLQNSES